MAYWEFGKFLTVQYINSHNVVSTVGCSAYGEKINST